MAEPADNLLFLLHVNGNTTLSFGKLPKDQCPSQGSGKYSPPTMERVRSQEPVGLGGRGAGLSRNRDTSGVGGVTREELLVGAAGEARVVERTLLCLLTLRFSSSPSRSSASRPDMGDQFVPTQARPG